MIFEFDAGVFQLKEKNQNEIISLLDAKSYINMNSSAFDNEYQNYLNSAINTIEHFLGYDLLNTKYYYYLKNFQNTDYLIYDYKQLPVNHFFICGKGNIKSVDEIAYKKINDTNYTIIDPLTYKLEIKNNEYNLSYRTIFSLIEDGFPNNYDLLPNNKSKPETVRIEITIGFGENKLSIPADIILAIKKMFAFLATNKGDIMYDKNNFGVLPFDITQLITKYRSTLFTKI